jgi:hypothetical protein
MGLDEFSTALFTRYTRFTVRVFGVLLDLEESGFYKQSCSGSYARIGGFGVQKRCKMIFFGVGMWKTRRSIQRIENSV